MVAEAGLPVGGRHGCGFSPLMTLAMNLCPLMCRSCRLVWLRPGVAGESDGALLCAVADRARSAGIGQVSLSVERRNYAHGLYLAEGYKYLSESGGAPSDTMIKEL